MRNLKMTFLAVALMVATVASAQFSFGVKGGMNLSNLSFENSGTSDAKIGFNIGLMADYDFAHNMAIQSGLFFTTKGAKGEGSIFGTDVKSTLNLMYLQIPVHFAYKIDVTPGTRLVFHAGPYIAYGVNGRLNVNGNSSDTNLFSEVYKPFDFGLGIGVGAEFGRILAGIGWDMGLLDINDMNVGGSIRNQNAFLTVGYRF